MEDKKAESAPPAAAPVIAPASSEAKEESKAVPSLVPANYQEICDKLLADLDKDYQKTIAASNFDFAKGAGTLGEAKIESKMEPKVEEKSESVPEKKMEHGSDAGSEKGEEEEKGVEEGYAPLEGNEEDVAFSVCDPPQK